jgi:hypothetical protein
VTTSSPARTAAQAAAASKLLRRMNRNRDLSRTQKIYTARRFFSYRVLAERRPHVIARHITRRLEQLPEGREGLWNFNALRHIKVGLDDWPEVIQKKAVSATLSLGHKALEEIKLADAPDTFTMFSGENILPLYVVQEPLVVTVHFRPALTENEMHLLPMSSIRAQGLMVNIKNEDKAFFVAASKLTALTWDGQCAHVNSATDSKDVEDYESLWNAVKMQSID